MRSGHWTMAWRNLARNKRRNAATATAVALGFAALLALGAYYHRVQTYLRVYTLYVTRVGHINIYKQGGLEHFSTKPRLYSLDERDQAAIRAALAGVDNIELDGPQLVGAGMIGNGCRTFPFMATGIDPALDRRLREHPAVARWAPTFRTYDRGQGLWNYPADLGAIALANGLARLLHKTRVHDELPPDQKPVLVADCLAPDARAKLAADTNVQLVAGTWSGMMSALDGEVVATYNTGLTETNHTAVLMPLARLQKLYETPNVTFWAVWLKNPQRLAATMADLRTRLDQAGLKVELYPWMDEAVAPMYAGTMEFLMVMVSFITVVLVTIISFSIFNAATMTVIERSPEIGMMRALGFTRTHIRRLFLKEMLILTALAIVAGAVIGAAAIIGINHAGIRFSAPGVAEDVTLLLVPNPAIVLATGALILALASLTTLVTVRSVARRNIAALLFGTQR